MIMVYITTPNRECADSIASACVESRLAACGNIIEGMTSVYRWQDRVCRDDECIVILKSEATLFGSLERLILSLHPYQCPCIVSWSIGHAHQPFLGWLEQNLSSGRS